MKAINAAHKHFLKNPARLETAEFTDTVNYPPLAAGNLLFLKTAMTKWALGPL